MIYAESFDKVGKALGALITSDNQVINFQNIKTFPEPQPASRTKMQNQNKRGVKPQNRMGMQSRLNQQPVINTIPQAHIPDSDTHQNSNIVTEGTKYQHIKASRATNDPNRSIYKTVDIKVYGFMERYIWFINGVPEYYAKPINLLPGKRYRLKFTNNSMMHHPLHLHGHWMIFRNGHGKHDPLLHTIDVPPGSMVTADLDTDASGQWIFHCHMLNHMVSGLARTFQYNDLVDVAKGNTQPAHEIKQTRFYNRPIVRVDELRPIPISLVEDPKLGEQQYWMANFIELGGDFSKNRQTLTYTGLFGSDFNKLQLFINDAEMANGAIENADIDIFYWRPISQFWTIKGGVNYFYIPSQTPYWQPGIGIEGLFYYFIANNTRFYYHKKAIKADVELIRNSQITRNFFIGTGIRAIAATKTNEADRIGTGLNQMQYTLRPSYRIIPGIVAFMEYEYIRYHGALKNIRIQNNDSKSESTLFFGVSLIV